MRKLLRILAWILGLVLALAVLGMVGKAVLGPMLGGGNHADTGITETWVETVSPGTLIEVVAAPGKVEARTKVEISARVSARILELPVAEGGTVSNGDPDANPPVPPDVLIRLDAADLEAQLESAQKRRSGLEASLSVEEARLIGQEAQLEGAASALRDAERELKRQTDLIASGDVSQQAVDQATRAFDEATARFASESASLEAARLGLNVSQFNLEAADSDIVQLEDALSYTTIVSPIDGVVTRLNVDVGEVAIMGTMNNPGTVLLEVADLSRMLVVAQIDEADIARVEPGQRVEARFVAYPGEVFSGTVQSVALASTSEITTYFETKVLLDPTEQTIRSGLSADVEIQVQEHSDVLTIPSQAALSVPLESLPDEMRRNNPLVDRTRTNVIVVYRVIDDKTVITPVRLGASDDLNTMVLAGLDPEDEVVAGPFVVLEDIAHDQAIKVTRRDGEDLEDSDDDAIASETETDSDSSTAGS